MNERIKEIAVQAGLIAPYASDREGLVDFDYRKFAQLIVAECMKLNSKELSITAIERLLPLYAEHFGAKLT